MTKRNRNSDGDGVGVVVSASYSAAKSGGVCRRLFCNGTFDELRRHLENNRPCIAFVKTRELPYWDEATNHAVLVVGLDKAPVDVNDPQFSNAPIKVSRGDFDLAWLEWDELYAVLMRRD